MMRAIVKGDKVRFRPKKIGLYQQIYAVTPDDVFVVEYIEPRKGKRVFYLQGHRVVTPRLGWIPAYASALLLCTG